MPRVAIIGTGLIGRSWAIVFARANWDVALYDPIAGAADQALAAVANDLGELKSHNLIDDASGVANRVRIVTDLADALDGATFVQENTPETVEAKRTVFADLDRHAQPDAILASSTSSIVPNLFTENLDGRQRCLVAHPVNPPHLVPLVELVGSPWTAPNIIARARQIYESAGQVPIIVKKEIEGFILNRLQGALLAEAFRLVGEGFVSPQDLDKTVKDGLGLRWSFMGPFETIELNAPDGIGDYCTRYAGFYQRLQANPATPAVYGPENIERVLSQWDAASPKEITDLARRRDLRLAELRAHKLKTKQT